MERLFDDAANIHQILPWIESQEEILFFLRNVPIHLHHLRIQLALSYFLNLRDQSEENLEKNIDEDVKKIVIILPDTPYNVIKTRLKELGNIPNRLEVLVKQLIKDRPNLKTLLNDIHLNKTNDIKNETIILEPTAVHKSEQMLNTTYNIERLDEEQDPRHFRKSGEQNLSSPRKREAAETLTLQNINGNNETNIKIKIRKVEGSLEVVSSIKQEFQSPPRKVRVNPLDEIINMSTRASNYESHSSPGTVQKTDGSSEVIVEILENNEVPDFDLVSYLKEISQESENIIIQLCKNLRMPLNKRPSDIKLNTALNALLSTSVNTIKIDDENNGIFPYNFMEVNFPDDSEIYNTFSKEYFTKDKCIIKPAKLNLENNMYYGNGAMRDDVPTLHTPTNKILIRPPRFNPTMLPTIPESTLGGGCVEQPAIPQSTLGGGIVDLSENISGMPDQTDDDLFEDLTEVPTTSAAAEPQQKQSNETLEEDAYDESLVFRLMEIFPEACPTYIRKICVGKIWVDLDEVINVILSEDYPKRRLSSPSKEVDIDVQVEIVEALLPDVNPTYVRWKCESIGNNMEAINEFINEAREKKNYPTMKEYLRKQKLTAQSKQYTTDFSVEHFVHLFPEPEKTFNDPKRTVATDDYTRLYISTFFQNIFDRLPVRTIRFILSGNNYRIVPSEAKLKLALDKGHIIKTRRKNVRLPDTPQNIAVLQELAYLIHKEEIQKFIEETKEIEKKDRAFAKENGLMNTCQCCYDEEVMPKNSFMCPKGCIFCQECIKKSCEVALGDGKTEFKCLNDCQEDFTLHVLQEVLPPKMFSRLAQKKALAEVKAAGIEELETCPFCDFATIPNAEDKIFRCLNPDCMKESCRLCKEENHVPYKCDELEKDEDVKARVFVENKMTEALLRKCWKCGTSFFKEEGCNKMTCTCGASMCYICHKPVTDYSHFNGIGGDKFHRCPLYSDSIEINQKNVVQAAEAAKSKVDPAKLKVDPTVDIEQHYENRKKEIPPEPHIELMNDVRDLHNGLMVHGNIRDLYVRMANEVPRRQRLHHHHHHHHHHHNLAGGRRLPRNPQN